MSDTTAEPGSPATPATGAATAVRIWQRYFYYFLIGCVAGYAYEYLLITYYYQTPFVNQGPLYGMLLIYGIGGVLLIALLGRFAKRKLRVWKLNLMPVAIALAIMVIVTVVEYIGHWTTETFFSFCPWDYSEKFLNINGRVCLEDSARFVVLGMLLIYGIVPLMEKLFARLTPRQNCMLFSVLAVAFGIDVVLSSVFGFPPGVMQQCPIR
ncbi:MAG: putative ABC transporter permease [Propionibacteriaceae bacterium]|nr:putative ABC transporter permease [Propionibacteriaceae bacterium]